MTHYIAGALTNPPTHARAGSPGWEPYQGCPTPWGPAQVVTPSAPGIWCLSTAGHGGFYVAPDRQADIPAIWRAYAERWAHGCGPGWFEEDVAAGAVVLSFPEIGRHYPPDVKHVMAGALEQFTKPTPNPTQTPGD